jgi:MoxR-like ATPase
MPSSERPSETVHAVVDAVETAIVGKRDVLELVLTAILTRGHVLLEDLPGLAKTLMARSFAEAMGLEFRRVQFTPDLLPTDITGGNVLAADGRVTFQPGPLFANLVLGDEINRAPPKTQSALLEAMQERQVTTEGVTHAVPRPFSVLATQNPIEFEGTYPLPEAQLDRFRLRVSVGYPERDDEEAIVARRLARDDDDVAVPRVTDAAGVLRLQAAVERVHVDPSITRYIVDIVRATRTWPGVEVGASPRGSLSAVLAARGLALVRGRGFVLPDDVQAIVEPALAHRLVLRPELWVRGVKPAEIVAAAVASVPAPAPVVP